MTKVVIVGASFAGLRAYAYLKNNGPKDLEITLIDKLSVATYIPSLYLSLGNQKYTHNIQISLQKHYPEFICANVQEVTTTHVRTAQQSYEFDYLILATGAETNFFGNNTFKQHTYPAKTAANISTINSKLRNAQRVTVVGGGLTGVEYAGILATRTDKNITIINATNRLVPGLPPKASRLTQQFFKRHNVELHLNAKVTSATEESLALSNGSFIKSDLTIWCAGLTRQTTLLSEELTTKTNIFLAGDIRKSEQIPTAHNAMICGESIAKSIIGNIQGENIPLNLHNWETLALALGSSYGVFIYKNKWAIRNPFTGIMKWVIERRVISEWKTKHLLRI